MADEGKGIALVILGIVAIVAVIGLVLMFMRPAPLAGQYGYKYPIYSGSYEGGVRNFEEVCAATCTGSKRNDPANDPLCSQCYSYWASKQVLPDYREATFIKPYR